MNRSVLQEQRAIIKQLKALLDERDQEISLLKWEKDVLVAALQRMIEWAKAYPVKVFPEPNFRRARELLEAGGMTLDAIGASTMRHVLLGARNIASEALQKIGIK